MNSDAPPPPPEIPSGKEPGKPQVAVAEAAPTRDGRFTLSLAHASILVRCRGLSLRLPQRDLAISIGLLLALVGIGILSLCLGDTMLTPAGVVRGLAGTGTRAQILLAADIRLPRAVAAALAGMALATAGCLLQTLTRNRLASPGFIGVNEGALLAILLSMTTLDIGSMGPWWVGPIGAAFAGCSMILLSGRLGIRTLRVIVAGIAIAALLRSVNELIMSRIDLRHASELYAWSLGSLASVGHPFRRGGWVILFALLPIAFLTNRALSLMRLHSEIATTLGLNLRLWQGLIFLAAVALAGVGVGIAGPIVFIGLAAPIAASRLLGWSPVIPLIPAACIGGILIILCDTVGRLAIPGDELPVGVLTSILGGPVLLWVLLTDRNRSSR